MSLAHEQGPEPIRIFKSNFLEKFTHVHLWQVVVVWGGAVLSFLAIGCYQFALSGDFTRPGSWIVNVLMIGLGVVIWTLSEYSIHRFIFHYPAKKAWTKKFVYFAHGIHHIQPRVKTRLLMPLAVSIPIGLLYFFLVAQFPWLTSYQRWLLMAALSASYLCYDTLHWAQHHSRSKNPYLLRMRRYHMRHHVQNSDTMRFGISQTWWDHLFATFPPEGHGVKKN